LHKGGAIAPLIIRLSVLIVLHRRGKLTEGKKMMKNLVVDGVSLQRFLTKGLLEVKLCETKEKS
jgi:hypothetical protein